MALFLEADDIRRINELVCRGTTGARIRVSQRNDVVLELSMIDELLNHPNGGQKEIRRVWWCSEEGAFNTEVRLWANEPSANVDVSVWGDDAEAVSIRGAAIEELLRQCRPLYAPLAENHAARLLLTLVYPLAIVDLIYLGAKYGPTEFWAAAVSSPPYSSLFLLMLVAVVVQLSLWAERVRRALFPILVLAIGQGRKRAGNLAFWRTAVLLTVLLGVLASYIANRL